MIRSTGKKRHRTGSATALLISLALNSTPSLAETAEPATASYQAPSTAVIELLTAAPPPAPLIHARSSQVALLFRQVVMPLQRLARPLKALAGYRYDPLSGTSNAGPLIERVELLDARTPLAPGQQAQTWQAGPNEGFEYIEFSPDGRHLSALKISDTGPARLAIYDIERDRERLLKISVNAAWGKPCIWVKAQSLLCRVVPEQRQKRPTPQPVPITIEHSGGAAPTRTYSNLLRHSNDDALFRHYFEAELAAVNIDGKLRRVPQTRGLIYSFSPSPDGSLAIVTRLRLPYPRLVPARHFPNTVEVWDLDQGQRLYGSATEGFGVELTAGHDRDPRRILWKPGTTNTAGYIEQQEHAGGNDVHRWLSIDAPFKDKPTLIVSSAQPINQFGWTTAGTPYYFVRNAEGSREHIYVVLENGPREIWSGEIQDRYHDPGSALRLDGQHGPVLEIDGRVFVAGDGLGPSGPRPFLDAYDLRKHRFETLFTGEPRVYEDILAILDPEGPVLLTSRETEVSPPNLYRLDGNKRTPLRPFENPYPGLEKTKRRVINYTREDGIDLSGTLYTPQGWDGKQPLPTLIWIYPYEYADREHAGQLDARVFRFHRVKGPSPLAAVLEGYAVLVNPTVPIVHDGVGMNDDYIDQLVASAEAAVDYLVDAGISDPDRIAVGGRSYGAFSSANLLVHSDKFATAIAMSGAYNRTLTPFGFQHEKRSFWDATELYTSISPFFHANDIDSPILLVHGGADPNPGTPTMQAKRFFHALVGEGVPARYVELPYEGHHYRARESVLDAANEMIEWLERTVGEPTAEGEKPVDEGN